MRYGRIGRTRIAFVVSDPSTATHFLAGHLRALAALYDVTLIANTDDAELLRSLGVDGETIGVRIERRIRPVRDLRALVGLAVLFRRRGFDAVHSLTPKAGLLSMAAAMLARVPLRTHTFTGQVWVTLDGPKRALLRFLDKVNHRCSSFSLVDSASQRAFLIRERVVRAEKSGVLADGSICGVDTERFRPDPVSRTRVRAELGLSEDELVFLFLGRLTVDKGVLDLAEAFAHARERHRDISLVIVGPDEEALRPRILAELGQHAGACRLVDVTPDPERYLAACDVFCLPSYREGFGSVLIEAAAAGVPSLASDIYGIDDAVIDGTTGLLHPPGDIEAISGQMERLIASPRLRTQLGDAGRRRALESFPAARVVQAMVDYYADRLPVRIG
ncbi:hypothetical protein EB75_24095 [Mycobacterium sp. ST-F2]|uniref:glycosyltransferase family 4 protein n=1 Tax=Mycobacterium sp. ST-F2 TaxID=1490484 RepID=UPI0009622AD4|nr:glycosyltransferase family 4 protein [Mycobacterium sp. ST-F2]OKH79434.1 hypothetical protein EB75_24095 [Mycobacterium sp. ST-F2]